MSKHRSRNKLGKSAWLVTWQSMPLLDSEPVAAVLRPQLGAETVRRLVELLYASSEYSTAEKIRWALRPDQNPYPAEFSAINGVPWQGHIHCGHNPLLFARLVDELRVEPQPDGTEKTLWNERPRPERGVFQQGSSPSTRRKHTGRPLGSGSSNSSMATS